MDVYSLFPGIEIIYNDFAMTACDCTLQVYGSLLEINYCYAGRQECQWLCGDHLYLGAGDLCITRMENNFTAMQFPTGRYRGLTVVLDMALLAQTPLTFLDTALPPVTDFPDKFCPEHHFFAVRANKQLAHIFAELDALPQEAQSLYAKLKIAELLLFLHLLDPQKEHRLEIMRQGQIETIKAVRQTLGADLTQDLTIDQLARQFCLSPTALKTSFKAVCGCSIKDYQRQLRMEQAAALLRTSSQTIAAIAEQVGYANQSKFAAAFKNHCGLSPTQYRAKCQHPLRS